MHLIAPFKQFFEPYKLVLQLMLSELSKFKREPSIAIKIGSVQ
jgi:hypothetical protein